MNRANQKPADVIGEAALSAWWRAGLFALAYFFCAEAGSYLSVRGGTYISFWLPAGLTVAVLLLNRTREWPGLLLAALPANLLFDYLHDAKPNVVIILLFYVANVVQATTGAWLVRRFVAERPTLAVLREFVGLVIFAGLFGTTLGATIGAATLVHFGLSRSFAQSWAVWWGSTAMAVLLLTPFLLTWCAKTEGGRKRFGPPKRMAEAAGLALAVVIYEWLVFYWGRDILSTNGVWAIPLLLWTGLRFGPRGATAVSLFVAMCAAFLTAQWSVGLTTAQVASGNYVFPLQTILAMASLVALIPAIVIGERNRTFAKLSESEEKFSKAFQHNPNGICITEMATGTYLAVNESFCGLFGYAEKEMIGRSSLALGIWAKPSDRELMIGILRENRPARDLQFQTRDRTGRSIEVMVSAEVIELGGERCVVTMLHDITSRVRAERERAEAQIRETQARTEYTLQLIASQEAERTRIAAELHDSLGQNLLLIKNHALLALAKKDSSAVVHEQLGDISTLATQAIAEVRQISHDLHPYQLDHLGLTRALEAMIDSAAQASGIVMDRKLDSVDDILTREAGTNLYRIVQETVNNILKHSGATRARIELERDVGEIQLRMEDDGHGFPAQAGGSGGSGLGLKNIAERTRILNGTLKVDSQTGRGTRIAVTLPIVETG
jgi:PAS domain S-box-containing protein